MTATEESLSLLDFLRLLISDDGVRNWFNDEPDEALAHYGLDNLSAADVYDALILIDDSNTADFDSDKDFGGNTINASYDPPHAYASEAEEHDAAIEYITRYVTNNYIDDRDTDASTTLNQQIDTGGGDFDQDLDIDTVVASGDGAVAAGEDIENSNIATGDRNVVGDDAQGVTGDGNTTAFGGGDATSTELEDVAVGPGGALSVGGDATGNYSDDDTSTTIGNYGSGDVNAQVTDDGSSANQAANQAETTTTTTTETHIEDSYNPSAQSAYDDHSEHHKDSDNEIHIDEKVEVYED